MIEHLVGTALTTVALAVSGNYGTVGDSVEQAGNAAAGVGPQPIPTRLRDEVAAAVRDTGSFVIGDPLIGTAIHVTGGPSERSSAEQTIGEAVSQVGDTLAR